MVCCALHASSSASSTLKEHSYSRKHKQRMESIIYLSVVSRRLSFVSYLSSTLTPHRLLYIVHPSYSDTEHRPMASQYCRTLIVQRREIEEHGSSERETVLQRDDCPHIRVLLAASIAAGPIELRSLRSLAIVRLY